MRSSITNLFIQTTGKTILACGIILGVGTSAHAITGPDELTTVVGLAEHCDDVVASGDFLGSFDCGDEFFETQFNAVDGGGANVGDGLRYTRVPRADLDGPGEWANHVPTRIPGPNAASCNGCHHSATEPGQTTLLLCASRSGQGTLHINIKSDGFT